MFKIQSQTKPEGMPSMNGKDTEAPRPSEETPSAAALMQCMPLVIEMITDVLRSAQNTLENDALLDEEIDLINLSQLVPENNVRGERDANHDADAEYENYEAEHVSIWSHSFWKCIPIVDLLFVPLTFLPWQSETLQPAPLADTSLDSNADPCTNEEILITPKKRAPIERISEAFLSDDDDDGSVSVANTGKVSWKPSRGWENNSMLW